MGQGETIKECVYNGLYNVFGECVFYFYPKSFTTLPAVSYAEINNLPVAFADGRPYLNKIEMELGIWAEGPASVEQTEKLAHEVMCDLGFSLNFSREVFEKTAGIYRKVARYEIIV